MTVTYVHDLAASKVSAISSKLLTDHEGDSHRARCEKRPSQCKCPDVHWIWASRPDKSEPVRSGKWMLFLSTMHVDSTWDKVKDLLSSGRLGVFSFILNKIFLNIFIILIVLFLL